MLRRIGLGCVCAAFCLLTISPALAQTAGEDSLYDTSYVLDPLDDDPVGDTTFSSGTSEHYIRTPLFFDDATPQPTGTMDFRLRFDYVTESVQNDGGRSRGNRGNRGLRRNRRARDASGDDFGLGLQWVWGCCNNVEFMADLPINLGDGRRDGDGQDGNYDVTLGVLYRLWEEETFAEWMPAFALQGKVRIPNGYNSSGVDGELRGLWTKTLGGQCRAHLNAFAITVNGDNDRYARDFQWGFVVGVDAPIADDLWVIVDYMHRSSEHNGNANMNMFEAGLEWKLDEGQSLHVSTQVGLDDNGDTPNFGARVAYTYELSYQ